MNFQNLSDVTPEAPAWLWEDRIPAAAVTLVEGEPGTSKTTIAYDLAARISTGRAMPGQTETQLPANVVLVQAEETSSVTRARLAALGADLHHIAICTSSEFTLPDFSRDLATVVAQRQPKLVVLQPVDWHGKQSA